MFQDGSPVTACLSANPTNVFGIPKLIANPGPGLSTNPSYAEIENLITLAYTNSFKAVVLYVDGCINGVPRVVGIDVVTRTPDVQQVLAAPQPLRSACNSGSGSSVLTQRFRPRLDPHRKIEHYAREHREAEPVVVQERAKASGAIAVADHPPMP